MKKFFSDNKYFFIPYLLFLVVGGILVFTLEKGSEILYFNALHNPFADQLFKWLSYLAEWPMVVLMLLIAARFSYGKGLILILNNLVVLLEVQVLKKLVFATQIRPSLFFEGKASLNFIEGVDIQRYHSFPSGHTAGAFAFCLMLSLLLRDKHWSIVFFALALLVGISRIYLLQHFMRDVYAGSLVAVISTSVFYLTFVRSSYYNNIKWKDKSLTEYV